METDQNERITITWKDLIAIVQMGSALQLDSTTPPGSRILGKPVIVNSENYAAAFYPAIIREEGKDAGALVRPSMVEIVRVEQAATEQKPEKSNLIVFPDDVATAHAAHRVIS